MDEQRPQLEALHEKISANRDALHQMLESGSADANAVGELVLEGRRLHEQSRALREAGQKAIRGALTPEQQKKFDTMQAQRRASAGGSQPRGLAGRQAAFGPARGAETSPPQGRRSPISRRNDERTPVSPRSEAARSFRRSEAPTGAAAPPARGEAACRSLAPAQPGSATALVDAFRRPTSPNGHRKVP
jgi:hypothetical protein